MKKNQWRYKVGSNFMGIILSFVLLGIFGGITLYLYRTGNGAFIFGMFLTGLAILVILLGIYRAISVKFLVNENGFYHQTKIGNGKFYRFSEIRKAWVSSGRSANGVENEYFNYELADGKVVKVFLMPSDDEAAEFMLSRIQENAIWENGQDTYEAQKTYEISGKTYSLKKTQRKQSKLVQSILAVVGIILEAWL